MRTDFDKPINRRGTDSYKWDIVSEEGVLPMWVADMDFPAAKPIQDALKQRIAHGVFGYTLVPDSYYDAIISWFSRRHSWTIAREHILYTSGVVPAASCVIKALTMPGERVLLQTPAYNCFFSSIHNNGCEVLETALLREGDSYVMDWDDMEHKCADEKTTVFLLCNPHNPGGRVWTREELEHMAAICHQHHVAIVSDEIHCELTMPGHDYTPMGTVASDAIVLCAPTKAFNIAGLQIANIVCQGTERRRRIDRAININEVCDVNPFGIVALQAAYNECEDWLDQLREYLWNNYLTLKAYVSEHLPQATVFKLEGTYLVWMDIRATLLSSDEATALLLKEGRVKVSSGTDYGQQAGEGFLRINIACPQATMLEGLRRIVSVLNKYPKATE